MAYIGKPFYSFNSTEEHGVKGQKWGASKAKIVSLSRDVAVRRDRAVGGGRIYTTGGGEGFMDVYGEGRGKNRHGHVEAVHVEPESRGRGFGQAMYLRALQDYPKLTHKGETRSASATKARMHLIAKGLAKKTPDGFLTKA